MYKPSDTNSSKVEFKLVLKYKNKRQDICFDFDTTTDTIETVAQEMKEDLELP